MYTASFLPLWMIFFLKQNNTGICIEYFAGCLKKHMSIIFIYIYLNHKTLFRLAPGRSMEIRGHGFEDNCIFKLSYFLSCVHIFLFQCYRLDVLFVKIQMKNKKQRYSLRVYKISITYIDDLHSTFNRLSFQ